MGEVNFAKNAPSAAPAPATQSASAPIDAVSAPVASPTPAPAPAPPSAPPVTQAVAKVTGGGALAPRGLVLGDKIPDFDDIILPRLNIVQNMGDLKDSFPLGALVFNQSTVVFTPPKVNAKTSVVEQAATAPVSLVCLGFRPTRFVEKVAGGGRGLIVKTEEEVRANGGTLDYNEWNLKKTDGMKRFEPLAEALVAIERPEIVADDDTVFVYPVDGKKYALALWGMKGTAYTAAAKRVFFTGRAMGCLRDGYPSRSFALTTRWQKFSETNAAWVPVLIPGQPSTPELLAWVTGVLNPECAGDTGAEG